VAAQHYWRFGKYNEEEDTIHFQGVLFRLTEKRS
jgi:hypothetical protein